MNRRNRKQRRNFSTAFAAVIAAGALSVTPVAVAQQASGGLGGAISGAINGSQTSGGQNSGGQSVVQRGVGQAVQGVINGQNAGDAIRSGLDEAARSTLETSQQTQQRDQIRANAGLQQNSSVSNGANGQIWQQDSQGRSYFINQDGQTVFSGDSGINLQNQNSGQTNSEFARAESTFGANLSTGQDGISVQSVQSGSLAAQAGLQSGDTITSINGRQVTNGASLNQQLNSLQGQQQVRMTIQRDGQSRNVSASLKQNQQTHTSNHANSNKDQNSGRIQAELRELRNDFDQLRDEMNQLKAELRADASASASTNNE